MMSIMFSAAIVGLGQLAHTVAEHLPAGMEEFELSQDGETVWGDCSEYSFVGFCEEGEFFASAGGRRVAVGRRLGRVKYEPGYKVWQLRSDGGDYIMITGGVDTAEIFQRVS